MSLIFENTYVKYNCTVSLRISNIIITIRMLICLRKLQILFMLLIFLFYLSLAFSETSTLNYYLYPIALDFLNNLFSFVSNL